ncbi:MAG: DUF421 domain-containing protein [Candidatus Nitrosoglobus sp.]|jgi:uncharacterized membrane protein YcaP (DUF421 family)
MDAVLRALFMYFFLLIIFRISGNRSMMEITTFDFMLLLIISEATQQALLGNDFSVTNALLVIMTLVGLDISLSLLKQFAPRLDRLLEGLPVVLVENGKPLKERMDKARVDEEDILTAARELQGLEHMEQIKYAVLERSGGITIVPKQEYK